MCASDRDNTPPGGARVGAGNASAGPSTGERERLLDQLPSMLGPSCREVLLVGEVSPVLASGLAARGLDVRVAAALAAAEGAGEAIVLLDPLPDDLEETLARAHSMLGEKGKLVLAASSSSLPRLAIALSERRFAILRQEQGVVLARRDTFTIREYRAGDEVQILAIFEGSFYVRRSLERWSWAYQRNPYGNLAISEAFNDAGELVAHYAGYPVRWRTAGAESLTALQVGDTMTHPSIRHIGRGPTSLLGRTVRHFYARFCENRVAFNYGFNTGNIQRFSMAFVGARRLEDLPFHVLEVAAGPRAPGGGLRARLAGWSERRADRFDERWDELFARVAPAFGMLVERDARYLDWRYRQCPDANYVVSACFRRGRLVGWGAFRRREDRLLWGDGLFDPGHPRAVARVLAHALSLPEHAGVRTVETWATARPAWWRPLLLDLGFRAAPEPNGLGLVFVPFLVDPEAEMRQRLYYTMADSDLF